MQTLRLALLSVVPLAALLVSASGAEAQAVLWENPAAPTRQFDPDRQQCHEIAQNDAARRMALINVSPMFRTQPATVFNVAGRQAMIQRFYEESFTACLGSLGWVRVPPEELARRAAAAQVEASARQAQLDAAVKAYLTAPPQLSSKYDEFLEESLFVATYAYLPNSANLIGFMGGGGVAVPKDSTRAQRALLGFRLAAPQAAFGSAPMLIIIADSSAPIRFETNLVSYQRRQEQNLVVEEMVVGVDAEVFRGLAAASVLRARLGLLEFTYPEGHLGAFRMVATHLRSPPPGAPPASPRAPAQPKRVRKP